MKIINRVEEVINTKFIRPDDRVYSSGNASTPQKLIKQMAADTTLKDFDYYSLFIMGDIEEIFSEACCKRINHKVMFSGPHSRKALNNGLAEYQLLHLSDIPVQIKKYIRPNVVLISVAGPDGGGNYSLGTAVDSTLAAVESAKDNCGIVIAERNAQMPFVLGTTIHKNMIDYIIDTDYDLPLTPVAEPDEKANIIGKLVAGRYIEDGCTLQYGIGQVPGAVTDAIIDKGVRDLGIHTELFSDSMRKLIQMGIVTNKYLKHRFSISSIFLSGSKEGYRWLHNNSSIQNRPADMTNNVLNIAKVPKMRAINSAMGIDLHGNIWADSLQARNIYSGIGGQADFLRGAYLSSGGFPIIALKSKTGKGKSKIVDKCPEGITTTAIAADPVVIVTENGVFDPRGLSICEHAIGIAHLADEEEREKFLKSIFESPEFYKPKEALREKAPKGFTPAKDILG
jgi:4-hydroxybutyrate CoA-transferase